MEGELGGGCPFFKLIQFVYQEDTFALGLGRGLHDPHDIGVPSELLNEDGVIARQNVGVGDDVHVNVIALLVLLSDRIVLFLHVFPISLDVLALQILSSQLIMIGKVIQQSIN